MTVCWYVYTRPYNIPRIVVGCCAFPHYHHHSPPTPIRNRFCNSNNKKHLLLAQLLSVVALVLSSLAGWHLAWICGIIVVILLFVACCTTLPRVVWIVVTILSVIAAVGELLVLIGVVQGSVYCGDEGCGGRVGTIVIGIIALLSWLIVARVSWRQSDASGNTANDLPR
jgi:hypothetical protein